MGKEQFSNLLSLPKHNFDEIVILKAIEIFDVVKDLYLDLEEDVIREFQNSESDITIDQIRGNTCYESYCTILLKSGDAILCEEVVLEYTGECIRITISQIEYCEVMSKIEFINKFKNAIFIAN